QLEGGDQQNRMLHRGQFAQSAPDERREIRAQLVSMCQHAAQGAGEEILISLVEAADLRNVVFDHRHRVVRQQPLIDALQRELARTAACSFSVHRSAFSRLAISTAHSAQSSPFSRMRTMAWSSFSVVSTPLAIGTPVSSPTRVMPAAISLETISKW